MVMGMNTLMGGSVTEAGVRKLRLAISVLQTRLGAPHSALKQVPLSWFYLVSSRCQRWEKMSGSYTANFPLVLLGTHGKPRRVLRQLLLFPPSVKIRLLVQDPFQHCSPALVFQPRQTSPPVSPKHTISSECSFSHPFSQQRTSENPLHPGTILGTRDTAAYKRDKHPCPHSWGKGLTFWSFYFYVDALVSSTPPKTLKTQLFLQP